MNLSARLAHIRAAFAPAPAAAPDKVPPLPNLSALTAGTPHDRLGSDVSRRLTPVRISALLKGASGGEPVDIYDLHGAMIRTWPRLAKNIQAIRRAASSAPWTVTAATDETGATPPEAEDRAQTLRRIMKGMQPAPGSLELGWRNLIASMAENTVRGSGVSEMLWAPLTDGSGPLNGLRAAQSTHPNYYAWPCSGTNYEAGSPAADRLLFRPKGRLGSRTALTEWPAHQFLVQLCPAWNEHPAMAGLLGPLGLWWVGANYGPQWLFSYAENFGIPFIYANYPNGDATARDVVFGMLRSLSGRKYAAFPEGTTLNTLAAAGNAGDLPQKLLIDHADEVCDILLLGQTLTTATGGVGSQALGNVHAGVKLEVLTGICQEVEDTLNEQLVPAAMLFNHGDLRWLPTLSHGLCEPEDEKARAERDVALLGAGVTMPRAWFYARHDIPAPTDGEEVIGGAPAAPAPAPAPAPDGKVKAAHQPVPDTSGFTADLTEVLDKVLLSAAAAGWQRGVNETRTLIPAPL